ncbi:MAG: hypothetical protein K8T20_13335 [Planctomycetes bacterium]|nr:hypothetical protein [Planctomycetota bacterium]
MKRNLLAIGLVFAALSLAGCTSGLQPRSSPANPFGWPAKLATDAGFGLESTEAPVLRDAGRILYGLGDFLEGPALAFEGLVLFRRERFRSAGLKFASGAGELVTGVVSAPFLIVPGRNVDLARDADLVNAGLEQIERTPPEAWHASPNDHRTEIFPRGTRVKAHGTALLWTIPGEGEILQAGEESLFFHAVQAIVPGTDYEAQERSWGMIVKDLEEWDSWNPRVRAGTIIHEFVHQYVQIRCQFKGWSIAYWPAYGVSFVANGWEGHWAERTGPRAAEAVDLALRGWAPGEAAALGSRRCDTQLGQIFVTIVAYREKFSAEPLAIEDLLQAGVLAKPGDLLCPADLAGTAGYVYLYPFRGTETPPDSILVYDAAPHPDGSRRVLRCNGERAVLAPPEFEAALREQREAMLPLLAPAIDAARAAAKSAAGGDKEALEKKLRVLEKLRDDAAK